MVQKSLVSYIEEQLGKGFSKASIRDHLLKYKYPPNVIEEAFQKLSQPSIHHEVHFSKGVIITLIVLAVGAASFGISIFFISQGKAPGQLLDLKADLLQNKVGAGDTLPFMVELSSLGSAGRYDVALSYYAIDNAEHIIASKTETVAVETRATIRAEIDLPDDIPPGQYSLRVNARFGDQLAAASEQFTVEKEKIPQPARDILCDDNDACTSDSLISGKCGHELIVPCCGNGICEDGESASCTDDCIQETAPEEAAAVVPVIPETPIIPPEPAASSSEQINAIAQKAKTDVLQAEKECSALESPYFRDLCYGEIAAASREVRFCNRIENSREKDNCYLELAAILKNSRVCESLSTDSRRDSCYINYVSQNNEDVCDKVVNHFLQISCSSLLAG